MACVFVNGHIRMVVLQGCSTVPCGTDLGSALQALDPTPCGLAQCVWRSNGFSGALLDDGRRALVAFVTPTDAGFIFGAAIRTGLPVRTCDLPPEVATLAAAVSTWNADAFLPMAVAVATSCDMTPSGSRSTGVTAVASTAAEGGKVPHGRHPAGGRGAAFSAPIPCPTPCPTPCSALAADSAEDSPLPVVGDASQFPAPAAMTVAQR